MGDAGIVDILGWDRQTKTWVIIEIKRDGLDSKAYAQAMRYRSWLSDYLYVRSRERECPYNEPYVLMIGTGVSDDIRFVRNIEYSDTRNVRNAYYSIYNIRHEVALGHYSSTSANNYYTGVCSEMERRFN